VPRLASRFAAPHLSSARTVGLAPCVEQTREPFGRGWKGVAGGVRAGATDKLLPQLTLAEQNGEHATELVSRGISRDLDNARFREVCG
jgi:hypothetical protein